MYLPRILYLTSVPSFYSLKQLTKHVLFVYHRKTSSCNKNVHSESSSIFWKGPPSCLLKDLRFSQTLNSQRYASSEDDVVCYSELKKLKKTGKVTLIDVRSKEETWRTGTIPGSYCIPLPELEPALRMSSDKFQEAYCKEKPDLNDEIVFVCRRGERSYKAMKQARTMGYEKSKTYQGGFLGWFNQEKIRRDRKHKPSDEEK